VEKENRLSVFVSYGLSIFVPRIPRKSFSRNEKKKKRIGRNSFCIV